MSPFEHFVVITPGGRIRDFQMMLDAARIRQERDPNLSPADAAEQVMQEIDAGVLLPCEGGNERATPGCGCSYCTAVYDEWGAQAEGFQRWFDNLPEEQLNRFFGLTREPPE